MQTKGWRKPGLKEFGRSTSILIYGTNNLSHWLFMQHKMNKYSYVTLSAKPLTLSMQILT